MVERIITPLPLTPVGSSGAVAPFQFVTTGEDNLRWRTSSTNTPSTDPAIVELSVRQLDVAGEIQVYIFRQTVPDSVTPSDVLIPLSRGAILNLAVRYVNTGFPTGATYTSVDLVRGGVLATATSLGQLLGDYVTVGRGLAWPGSPIRPWNGRSFVQRRYTIPNGGFGVEASLTFNFPLAVRPIAVDMTFAASAAAGTRFPTMEVVDLATGLAPLVRFPLIATIGPSGGGDFAWGVGYGAQMAAVPPRFYGPIPAGLLIPPSYILRTQTSGLQAGDQWVSGYLIAEELVWPGL